MNTLLRRLSVGCLAMAAAIGVSPGGLRAEPSESAPVNSEAQSAISISGSHACAVTTTGDVKCWGNNNSGQVGIVAGTTYVAGPVAATGMTNAVSVVTGQDYSCALDDQGDMYCWGSNSSGQLGIGNNNSTHVASAVVNMPAPVVSIGAGWYHTCAALDTGQLACWGSGQNGQLGQNVPNSNAPILVQGLTSDITAVSAGEGFTCALSSSGSVTCFGKNSNGESGALPQPTQQCFGVPPFQFCNTVYADAPPTAVTGFGSATAEAVSAGTDHACAVLSDGTVACWGRNDAGQLGVSGGSNHVAAVVPGVSDAVAVTAGADHTCALETSGTVKCWGSNANGQLGDGTTTDRASATPVAGVSTAVAVTAGTRATCAASTSGAVQCWGDNWALQLGRGRPRFTSTPELVTSLPAGVQEIAAGRDHSCASYANGELRCWGSNLDNKIDVSANVTYPVPTVVSGVTSNGVTVTSMGLGYYHTCVSLSDGTVKCWGRNNFGQLGRGDTVSSGVPTSPSGLNGTQVAKVFAHGDMSCLITVAGEARCWGSNWSGQLGVGDTNHRSIPTAVTGLAGLTVVDIAIGQWHVCFMYTDGVIAQHGVKCVGRNIVRMLGTGATTDPTLTPTDVVGLTSGVVEIEAGMWHSCAIMNDSTMKCWGNSGVGELGNGTNTRLEIAAAVPNLTGIQKMIIGDRHTCVVNTSQAMTCWGGNGDGQLGLGDTNNRNVPVALSTMTSGVTEVAAGGEDQNPGHTCALKDGSVYCWGSDASSQSALGYEPQSSIAVTIAGLSVPIPVVVPTPSPQVPVFIPPSSSTPPTVAPRPFDESMVIGAEPVTFSGLSSQLFSGQSVSFEASGFTPGAAVDVYLASTPRLLTTVTADVSGKVSVGFTVPGDLVGEHHVVLYEPESGRAVRQAVIIAPLTLPVTGPGESSTDLVVTIALFLLIFGVLGEKFARQRRFLHPEHQ